MNLAEKLLRTWDKSKGEVIIDLEIMEVSRIKMQKLGIDLGQNIDRRAVQRGRHVPDGRLVRAEGPRSLQGHELPDQPARRRSSSSWRPTPTPRSSPSRGSAASVPRRSSTWSARRSRSPRRRSRPFAAGGVSQQPIVNYNYQDVGIDVKIKPRIHYEKEVTLELEIKITSIAGTGIADIPIITTREVKNVIRLKDGETNLLAGLLKDEERQSLKGIAGLKDIPLLGSLFSNTDTTIEQTDVILTITPYIIRTVPLTEEDSQAALGGRRRALGRRGRRRQAGREEIVSEAEPSRARVRGQPSAESRGRRAERREPKLRRPQPGELRGARRAGSSGSASSSGRSLEIGSLTVNLSFNPQIVRLKEVTEGGLGRQLGEKVPFLKNIDNAAGACTIGLSSPIAGQGDQGRRHPGRPGLRIRGPGRGASSTSPASTANGPTGQPLQFESNESRVVVR